MSGYVTPWMRCLDCGKIVKINKPLIGGAHFCLTICERRGRHSAKLRVEKFGWLWRKRRYRCSDCYQLVAR